jgi:hypothetical protein
VDILDIAVSSIYAHTLQTGSFLLHLWSL